VLRERVRIGWSGYFLCVSNHLHLRLCCSFQTTIIESLYDLEGLLGYCQEKIKLGHYCLYCEKVFPTWQGCQNHMISKQHTKLRYEKGYWDELDPFYDFQADNAVYDEAVQSESKTANDGDADMGAVVEDDGDEDGWEDMSEDGKKEEDEVFDGYEKEIARFGLDVTPLGELVFPDGRIIGHRALHRYYKQNHRPTQKSTAFVAASKAAGERIYEGQVINIGGNTSMPREQMKGCGKGILVGLKDGAEGFSALSLYRYRAAVRKQRREHDVGKRLYHRTKMNMNKMDKKANRMTTGVSVAHAPR
jgi:pre-60S factor REI1